MLIGIRIPAHPKFIMSIPAKYILPIEIAEATRIAILNERGLLNFTYPVESPVSSNIVFKNTFGFAFENTGLVVDLNGMENYELKIFSISGSTIYSESGNANMITISPSLIPSGTYIVSVTTKDAAVSKQIVKIN